MRERPQTFRQRAASIVERLDGPVYKVDPFGIAHTTVCPVHGKPSSIVNAFACGECYQANLKAVADAITLVREIVGK